MGHSCVLQALQLSHSSRVLRGSHCHHHRLPAESCQQRCQAVRMGKTPLCQGRKQISISYCTSCRLRHGELSGKTMASSSLSYEAILSDADVQAVKWPQLPQLSLLCLRPASGLWHGSLLPPHQHFHHWTHFHHWEWGHAASGKFPAVSKATDRQTAPDEPPLSAELGLILRTSGKNPAGHFRAWCPRAGWEQTGVRVGSWVPSTLQRRGQGHPVQGLYGRHHHQKQEKSGGFL